MTADMEVESVEVLCNDEEREGRIEEIDNEEEREGGKVGEIDNGEEREGGRVETDNGEEREGERVETDNGEEREGERVETDNGEEREGERVEIDNGEEREGERVETDNGEERGGRVEEIDNGEEREGGRVEEIDNGVEREGGRVEEIRRGVEDLSIRCIPCNTKVTMRLEGSGNKKVFRSIHPNWQQLDDVWLFKEGSYWIKNNCMPLLKCPGVAENARVGTIKLYDGGDSTDGASPEPRNIFNLGMCPSRATRPLVPDPDGIDNLLEDLLWQQVNFLFLRKSDNSFAIMTPASTGNFAFCVRKYGSSYKVLIQEVDSLKEGGEQARTPSYFVYTVGRLREVTFNVYLGLKDNTIVATSEPFDGQTLAIETFQPQKNGRNPD